MIIENVRPDKIPRNGKDDGEYLNKGEPPADSAEPMKRIPVSSLDI